MLTIRALRPSDDRTGFRCGDPDLDAYFLRFAGQNQFRHHVGVTYLALDNELVVGFVTVSAAEVLLTNLPAALRKKLPPFPLPGLRVARLAVDHRAQGQGVGTELLRFALGLARRMRDELGCVGVLVDSKPTAIAFYESYGFQPLALDSGTLGDRPVPTVMFLPVASIG